VATWLSEVALVLLVLAFPSGALRRTVDQLLVALIAVVIAVLFVPTALMTDGYPVPSIWTTCDQDCPPNAFQVLAPEPAWIDGVVIPLREVVMSLLFLAVTVRLIARIIKATTLMRRTLIPVLAGAVVHAVALPAGFALRRADGPLDVVVTLAWLLAAGLPIVAVAFLVGAARWRLAVGSALYRLAPRLDGGAEPDEVRAILADTLEDPTLDVVFRGPDGRWLDHAGRPTTLPARRSGRAFTVVGGPETTPAAIVHDAALTEQRDFVRAVGALAVMALANERLTARVETSLHELRSSRERILAAADDERRRIERDLHDGAQQRLVALRIKLELASERSIADNLPDAAQLRQLSQDAGDALDDVRSLAAGVYPALLVDGGLRDALNAIARRSPVPVSVAARGLERYPQDVEAAVYFCCLEALQNAAKHAGARAVAIEVTAPDRLRFEVRDDGRGFDAEATGAGRGLTNIRDRLAAVGGDLTIESGRGRGTRIAGSIPLRS
jgi:signal transduction histidine kinase